MKSRDEQIKDWAEAMGETPESIERMLNDANLSNRGFYEFSAAAADLVSATPSFKKRGTNRMPKKKKRKKR